MHVLNFCRILNRRISEEKVGWGGNSGKLALGCHSSVQGH